MNAPSRIETARLILSVPQSSDAAEVFDRYANNPEVTLYLGWPTHRTLEDTQGFLAFSTAQWERDGVGPYLIRSRGDGRLLGSTGLGLEPPAGAGEGPQAVTGYVLAADAWGLGYATEALRAMIDLASSLGIVRLFALCHPQHAASVHVLEKCGFSRDRDWANRMVFPNLTAGVRQDVWRFTRSLLADE